MQGASSPLQHGVFLFAKGAVSAPCHPERSKAESNFFLRDSKRYYAAFDPRYARISTTLRMTRRKKRRALRDGIYFCASRTKRKSGCGFSVSITDRRGRRSLQCMVVTKNPAYSSHSLTSGAGNSPQSRGRARAPARCYIQTRSLCGGARETRSPSQTQAYTDS